MTSSYVIFICNYDPYKDNRYIYSFENRCIQDTELVFGDEKFNSSFPAMITNNNVEQICNALNEAQYSIERNAYAKITLMQLSFRLSKAIKNR